MPIDKVCLQCGQGFRVKPKNVLQKFCSKPCVTAYEATHGRVAARVAPVDFTCAHCGVGFQMGRSYVTAYRKKHGKDPLYCSMKCMGLAKRLPDDAWHATCVQCGKGIPLPRRPGGTINRQRVLCSTECRSLFRSLAWHRRNPNLETTRRIGKGGYVRLCIPGSPGQPSRDVLEHRYVMEQHLGRDLLPDETVHHINGVRSENEIKNLELFSSRHGPGQRVVDKVQFAIDILRLYPEFARAANVELREHVSDAPPESHSGCSLLLAPQ